MVLDRTKQLEFANNQLKVLSETDSLTQIANRRVYEQRLVQEIASSKRTTLPLALIMIDIDYFKKFNDNYGHDAGDQAITRIAKSIKESLPRKTDLAARYGGEEFVVLMPSTNSNGAYIVAEQIRTNVKALAITHMYSDVANVVTVSIGFSSLQGRKLNETNLLKHADSALYCAKENGRNQCVDYKNTKDYCSKNSTL